MPDGTNISTRSRAKSLLATGAELQRDGNLEAGRLHYLAALNLEPDNPAGLINLAGVLYGLKKFEAGASVGRRAVQAAPNDPSAWENLAVSLTGLGKTDEARNACKKALALAPNRGSTWFNYGNALYRANEFSQALNAFENAIKFCWGSNDCLNDRSLSLLALGRVRDGLTAYEIRWKSLFLSPIWQTGIREWKGEDLDGKHILLHHEQGYGDTIMLCRFIPALIARGAKVTVAAPEPLQELLRDNFAIDVIDWLDEAELKSANADFHSPLLSAMLWLGIEPKMISAQPYLKAKPRNFKLPNRPLKIGLCWASGDHGKELSRRRRYVPLELLLPLTEIPDVQIISLQKGGPESDICELGLESIIFDAMNRCDTFAETASLITQLDAVIAVDSAVVHLAGALGKPTLMLGPFTRCWRWWGGETGWPWYGNFRIAAQKCEGDWTKPISASRSFAEKLAASK